MKIPDYDMEVLYRFLKGKIVATQKEERVLEEYRKIGWVRTGMRFNKKDEAIVKVIPTAKLTLLGKQFVKRAKILSSPWKRYFYKLINLPA